MDEIIVRAPLFPIIEEYTEQIPVSLFEYDRDRKFTKKELSKKEIYIGGVEKAILYAVCKYGVCTKFLIELLINDTLPVKMQHPSYDSQINALVDAGYLSLYSYADTSSYGMLNPRLYAPTLLAYKEIETKISYKRTKEDLKLKPYQVFELAQVSQWHGCVYTYYKKYKQTSKFLAKTKILGNYEFILKSLLVLSGDDLIVPCIGMCAIAFPKILTAAYRYDKKDIEQAKGRFLNEVMSTYQHLSERNELSSYFLVILVEDYDAIEAAYSFFHSYDTLKDYQIYYCIDSQSRKTNVLDTLVMADGIYKNGYIERIELTSASLFAK